MYHTGLSIRDGKLFNVLNPLQCCFGDCTGMKPENRSENWGASTPCSLPHKILWCYTCFGMGRRVRTTGDVTEPLPILVQAAVPLLVIPSCMKALQT